MTDRISANFLNPPAEFSPIPFWWWSGIDLDPDQLKWQLDRLAEKGIMSAVIGYSHLPDGRLDQGRPAIWSERWWVILLEILDHAQSRGMTLGMQDYIILNSALAEAGTQGAALQCFSQDAQSEGATHIAVPADGKIIEVTAHNGSARIMIECNPDSNVIEWSAPSGGWTVHVVFARPMAFDPLAAGSGELSLELFQEKVAANIGHHLGTTLRIFFQDELDFHGRWPFWSDEVPALFTKQHGYELNGRLAELWSGKTPSAVKLRLDYHETVVGLLEAHYFKPIKDWHDRNACLYGHDNAGRGAVGRGRDFYGDYMRTMRWYSAPGSDDPDLRGPRAFVGLKVASSLATLYARPRVWAECFHSSGWGATPDQLMAATNSAFALGANLINLHGLYASTRASWWEWAPPDFHFRQPYWTCMDVYARYVARVSWLMSQGGRRADVAILYPTIALAGGLNEAVSPDAGPTAYSEQQRGEVLPQLDRAEFTAFSLAQDLFNDGVDVDFIDDQSIENAIIRDGNLRAGGGEWRTIILTEMSAMRLETLHRLQEFKAAGGRVVLIGGQPTATNASEIKGEALQALIVSMVSEQFATLDGVSLDRIVPPHLRALKAGKLQVLRRSNAEEDIFLLHNPSLEAFRDDVTISGRGLVTRLDPETGLETACTQSTEVENTLRVTLDLGPQRIAILRVGGQRVGHEEQTTRAPQPISETARAVVLEGPWSYSLVPTMDNRHRDFAGEGTTVGLEINRLKWRENIASDWVDIAIGHAPRYLMLGPVPTGTDLDDWVARLSSIALDEHPAPLVRSKAQYDWRECLISRQDGILDDPWLKNWACGPHGLKDKVPEDYIDCGENAAGSEYIICGVISAQARSIIVSSQAAYSLWIDGRLAAQQPEALPPQTIPPWNLPTYEAPALEASVEPGKFHRFVLRLCQPYGQRLRAHLGIFDAPEPDGRGQRYLADSRFSIQPNLASHRRTQFYRFDAPPGSTAFSVRHHGTLSATRAGQPLSIKTTVTADGWTSSRVTGGRASDPVGAIELRLDETGGLRAGDALSRIIFESPCGIIEAGDWCQQGLAPYSGGVRYTATVNLPEVMDKVVLQTGEVGSCCEVMVNGNEAGKLICAPWELDVSRHIRPGENVIDITVFNTLANHFVENTPSPYAHEEQTVSGLLHAPKLLVR